MTPELQAVLAAENATRDAIIAAVRRHPEQPSEPTAERLATAWADDFRGLPIGLIPDLVLQRLQSVAHLSTMRRLENAQRVKASVAEELTRNLAAMKHMPGYWRARNLPTPSGG